MGLPCSKVNYSDSWGFCYSLSTLKIPKRHTHHMAVICAAAVQSESLCHGRAWHVHIQS